MAKRVYEDEVRQAGADIHAVQADAAAKGYEWVPSSVLATPPRQWEQGLEALQGQFPPSSATQRGLISLDPSIGPPTEMERFGMSMAPAFALPAFGGAVAGAGIGAQMLGQGAGMAANEAFNYATQPPAEQPSLGGAALRTGLGVAATGLGGYVANKFAPAFGKGGAGVPRPSFASRPEPPVAGAPPTPVLANTARALPQPPIPTQVPEKISRGVATDLGQSIKDKVDEIFGGLQTESVQKTEEIKSLVQQGEESMVDVQPLLKRLRTFFGDPKTVATMNPAEDSARSELLKRASQIEKEAKQAGGRLSLDRAYRALTKFGARGYEGSPESKSEIAKAYRVIRSEFGDAVEQHVAAAAPESAERITEYNRIIHAKLSAAEDLDEFVTTDPAVLIRRLQNIPDARRAIEKMDEVFGTQFTTSLDDYTAKVAEVDRLRKAIPAANQEAQEAFRTTSKAMGTQNTAEEAAAKAISKVNQQKYLAEERQVQDVYKTQVKSIAEANKQAIVEYRLAVKAAEASKQKAVASSKVISHLLGGVLGFVAGDKLGLPGSRWAGLVLGGAMGSSLQPGVARGLAIGGKVLPPLAYPTEVAVSDLSEPERKAP